MLSHYDARKNRLLAALLKADLRRWSTHLLPVELPLGMVLYESRYAEPRLFPDDCNRLAAPCPG